MLVRIGKKYLFKFSTKPLGQLLDYKLELNQNITPMAKQQIFQKSSEIFQQIIQEENIEKAILVSYLSILKDHYQYDPILAFQQLNTIRDTLKQDINPDLYMQVEQLANLSKLKSELVNRFLNPSYCVNEKYYPQHYFACFQQQSKSIEKENIENFKDYILTLTNFHQILYYTVAYTQIQFYNKDIAIHLYKSLGSISKSMLDASDMITFAYLLKIWQKANCYFYPIDKLVQKFDHYLQRIEIPLEFKTKILYFTKDIDYPSKQQYLCNESIQQSNNLQSYEIKELCKWSNFDLKDFKNVQERSPYQSMTILQCLIWEEKKNKDLIRQILNKLNQDFQSIKIDYLDQIQKAICCTLYQSIYTLNQEDKMDVQKEYPNIPHDDLKLLYVNRTEQNNSIDLSLVEQEVEEFLLSQGLNIERQLKVDLFSVDFYIQNKNKYIDIIGVNNKRQSWRKRILTQNHNILFIDILDWKQGEAKLKLINYLS